MNIEPEINVVEHRFEPPVPKEHARPCGVLGCKKRTSDQKPYCVRHINRIPYVKKILTEMASMTDEEIFGGSDRVPKDRRRHVVPIEFQVGETRYWIGLVKARGIEKDPEPLPITSPARVRADRHVKVRPFTRLLNRNQSKHVLICLQTHSAWRIPKGWLVQDEKLVSEVLKRFGKEDPNADTDESESQAEPRAAA